MMGLCESGDLTKRSPTYVRQIRRKIDGAGRGVLKTNATMLPLGFMNSYHAMKQCVHITMSSCVGAKDDLAYCFCMTFTNLASVSMLSEQCNLQFNSPI
jgi:hypothetical protein